MIKSHILGFPRIGEQRELKFALERHWRGEIDEAGLHQTAAALRTRHWQFQIDSGLDHITVGDFSYYDLMADHIQLLGCEPERFKNLDSPSELQRYFTMVRGKASAGCTHSETFALEMTKWFDTNYHYMVPEFTEHTRFAAKPNRLLAQIDEAQRLGHPLKVSLIGPLTFLYLGKSKQAGFDTLNLLPRLLDAYVQVLQAVAAKGVQWVQIDEPILGLDLPGAWVATLENTYLQLKSSKLKILLATYFASTQGHTSIVCKLPVDGLHVDCVRAPEDLPLVLDWLPNYKVLSLGLVDGRNVWKTDLEQAKHFIDRAFETGKGEIWIAPSCSLLHSPYRFSNDQTVHPDVKPWLAGALERLDELQLLKTHAQAQLAGKTLDAASQLAWRTHQAHVHNRANSPLLNNAAVKARLAELPADADQRHKPFEARKTVQRERFNLPL
ncbi:MAG TPA: 5-methyltetrahydropteroyltriglutamate--homocysteine S-methyltransferase, partial [Limnobacter sp.]|nr:5-methyltetrahydropteroyltriglutamate--homocysteine S-methyltransferase [Limnobacter sp.]